MAGFCSNCGFPVGESVSFCSKCGARQSQTAAAAAAKSPGSGVLKVVVVLVVVLMFFGIAAVGAVYYIGHRVKQAVVAEAEKRGVDLSPVESSSAVPVSARKKACDLISKREVESLLGETVDHFEPQDESCVFYAPPGRTAALARENIKQIPNQGGRGPEDIARVMKSLSSSTLNGDKGEPPLVIVSVNYDAAAQWTALQAGGAIFSGIPGAGPAPVTGVGDKAMRMVPFGLTVLKGTTVVGVIPGPVPGADEKTIAVAKLVISHL